MTMGCRVLYDDNDDQACLYDSVTMTAFGRVFSGPDANLQADRFLEWYEDQGRYDDPRVDPAIGEAQDDWLTLMGEHGSGPCTKCGAEEWQVCDQGIPEGEHERAVRS
jgi:hypothetical protein